MAEKNIHEGHRERMRSKYKKFGMDCLEDHEKLELLLFSVYTRCNTNDISHRLLDRFGTLHGVFEATASELMEVESVGEKAAYQICLIGDLFRSLSANLPKRVVLNTPEAIAKYCRELVGFHYKECSFILFLDSNYELIGRYRAPESTINSTTYDIRDIAERALKCKCAGIVVTHSHEESPVAPSSADIVNTRLLGDFIKKLSISFEDHIIIGPDSEYSMRSSMVLPDIWG